MARPGRGQDVPDLQPAGRGRLGPGHGGRQVMEGAPSHRPICLHDPGRPAQETKGRGDPLQEQGQAGSVQRGLLSQDPQVPQNVAQALLQDPGVHQRVFHALLGAGFATVLRSHLP